MNWKKELEIAADAAREAASVAASMQAGIAAVAKSDGSPVTEADKRCEQIITARLLAAFPDDGLLGEEGASRESASGRRWIVDPIDGTRDYLRGNPLWANLIGLEENGEVVAGIVNLPALGAMYTAARGEGAWRNGVRIRASEKVSPADSVFCLNGFNRAGRLPFSGRLYEYMSRFWAVRSLGGAPDAMLIASGQAELWIEPVAAPWDLAALKIVLEEAGALFFNFDGGASIYGGNCVACAPGLLSEARALLG